MPMPSTSIPTDSTLVESALPESDFLAADPVAASGALDRVVVQFGGRTLKGYTDRARWPAEADLGTLTLTPPIRPLASASDVQIPLDGVKAVFFVQSFDGKWHEDLRFHDHLAPQDCLWVRATFRDGEVIEGLIANNCHFVIHGGFYLFPVDPEGNNLLMYVIKSQLANLQILGLRPTPRTMPRMGGVH
jgi:hypothetical protein